MTTTHEPRLNLLDAWRKLPPERRVTDEHARDFAREYVLIHPEIASVIAFDQLLAWLKEDLRISRALTS